MQILTRSLHTLLILSWFWFWFCFSSDPREVVGHRPAVFPDHHDEDRTHQTRRVHGLPEEVTGLRTRTQTEHFKLNSGPFLFGFPRSVPTFQDLQEETLSKLADVMEEVSSSSPPSSSPAQSEPTNQALRSVFRLTTRTESTSSAREPEETPSSSSAWAGSVHPPLPHPQPHGLTS